MKQTAVTSPYVDYAFYTDTYHGDDIPADEFQKFSARGEDLVDIMTWNRIPDIPDWMMTELLATKIRKAVCAAAEQYKMLDMYRKGMLKALETSGQTGGVSSESNDGYSVSYRDVLSNAGGLMSEGGARNAFETEAKIAIWQYLVDTGLLYRGAGDWHDALRCQRGD